jgi:ribonuclease PH
MYQFGGKKMSSDNIPIVTRTDGRKFDQMRPIKISRNYLMYPEGSVLVEIGNTKVIVTASVEKGVPIFMRDSNNSWITAEYSMLPRATDRRNNRDRGHETQGRSVEIQRLIGRALRSAFDLDNIGEVSIKVDCDVIQADGGTRCASITGGFVAVFDALRQALTRGMIQKFPIYKITAAISVGIIKDNILLDLAYVEDSNADVDSNFVMTDDLSIAEIQGTSERKNFTKDKFFKMVELAEKGIKELTDYQKEILQL